MAEYIRAKYPKVDVKLLDVLSRKSVVQRSLSDSTTFLLTSVFAPLYDFIWRSGSLKPIYDFFVWFRMRSSDLKKDVAGFDPDGVICTHSLATSLALSFRKRQSIRPVPIFAVSTDYGVHPYWPKRGLDGFFVANEASKRTLVSRGVKLSRVFAYGIPIRSGLGQSKAKPKTLKYFQFKDALKIVVLAGGRKAGPYVAMWPKIYRVLALLQKDNTVKVELNIVLGEAKFAKLFFDEMGTRLPNVHVRGYVQNMPDLLKEADMVVCKPGGLIVAETLAAGLPLLLINKGGGQEAQNANFIMASKAGLLIKKPEGIVDFLHDASVHPARLASLRRYAAKVSKPNSARDVSNYVLSKFNSNS